MTAAGKTGVRSTLASKMACPGGRTMADAVKAAEAGLDSHRSEAMHVLALNLAQLEAVCAAQDDQAAGRVYELASALADTAGLFDTGPLYAAVFNLCETSDRMSACDCWHWPSVQVHVRALRLIFAADCRHTEASSILLEGLASIVARLPTPSLMARSTRCG